MGTVCFHLYFDKDDGQRRGQAAIKQPNEWSALLMTQGRSASEDERFAKEVF